MGRRARPTPWTEEEAKRVEDILIKFNGLDSVCAVMGCDKEDIDYLCEKAFGEDFEHVYSRCRTVGETNLKCCLYDNALGGNMKAADMLARKYLDMKPGVGQRSSTAKKAAAKSQVDNMEPPEDAEETPERILEL